MAARMERMRAFPQILGNFSQLCTQNCGLLDGLQDIAPGICVALV
jgi:hypothetical protein